MGCGDLRLLNGRAHRCVEGRKRAGLVNLTEPYYSFIGRQYDVDAEAERFLMIKNTEAVLRELTVVRNWFQELTERVPVP